MKTIEIQDDVYQALEKQVRGFNDTPSSVIRRLLAQAAASSRGPETKPEDKPNGTLANPFSTLLASPKYSMANAGERYFQLLSFLHQLHGEEQFSQLTTVRFGGRTYFAHTAEAIEESGSSTNPKPIPGTKLYALSTLSNSAKRKLITAILRLFKYDQPIINQVIATLPDSGITKPRTLGELYD